MTKVGILTCANSTQDLGCSSVFCLEELNNQRGAFGRYAENGGAQLMGIISCAGCPTAVAPEKIISRVRALAELGAEAIHISSCMMSICPYKNKYEKVLTEAFPDVEVVVGTHGSEDDKQEIEMFRQGVKGLLTQPKQTMVDLVHMARKMAEEQKQAAG